MLVTYTSRCALFLVGRPMKLGIMAGLFQKDRFALFPCSDMYKAGIPGDNAPCAVFAGMRGSLFGALCIGTGLGGHVHRDMTPTIRCRTVAAYRQRTCHIHRVRTTTTTLPSSSSPPPLSHTHTHTPPPSLPSPLLHPPPPPPPPLSSVWETFRRPVKEKKKTQKMRKIKEKERKIVKKKKTSREGPKRLLPAEDDFAPKWVLIDHRNQSFFFDP